MKNQIGRIDVSGVKGTSFTETLFFVFNTKQVNVLGARSFAK